LSQMGVEAEKLYKQQKTVELSFNQCIQVIE
jgi:hypothetical protein